MRLGVHKLLSLFLAAMLVAGQWGGQLHALSHAQHELAVAGFADAAGGSRHSPAPIDHSADLCVAFHALDGAAVAAAQFTPDQAAPKFFHADSACAIRAAEALPFLSRAPPFLS